jgi:hypothetical protein
MKSTKLLAALIFVGFLPGSGVRAYVAQVAVPPKSELTPVVHASDENPVTPAGTTPLSPEFLAKVPSDLRAAASNWLTLEPRKQEAWLKFPESQFRDAVLFQLTDNPAATDFLLSRLPQESPAIQRRLLAAVGYADSFRDSPNTDKVLQGLVAHAADLDVVLAAANVQDALVAKRNRLAFQQRYAAAEAAHDTKTAAKVADEDERWLILQRRSMLPGFLRQPPPVFSVLPADRPVHLVGFGDFGTGSPAQHQVAAAIAELHADHPFNFGLTFGDNFYPSGMTSTTESRWRDWWENLYGPLKITFYPTFGNHDWYHPDSPAAEILYSEKSASWKLPSPYYTFTAGPVQFFALDTSDVSEAQLLWLDKAISESTARWKIVYGHHPVYAPTNYGLSADAPLRNKLMPLFRHRVDLYLSGHYHALGRMEPEDGVHFVMSGGGGAPLLNVNSHAERAEFAKTSYGFLTVNADAKSIVVTTYDADGHALDHETITK